MSYYVRRWMAGDPERRGWVGPIRSKRQAQRERDAWRDAGWQAVAWESTPEIRAEVRVWQKAVKEARDAQV